MTFVFIILVVALVIGASVTAIKESRKEDPVEPVLQKADLKIEVEEPSDKKKGTEVASEAAPVVASKELVVKKPKAKPAAKPAAKPVAKTTAKKAPAKKTK